MNEYIVSVDDDLKDFDEMFVGNVRDGDVLTRCKDCVQYYVPKPIKWAKRDAEGNFIGYEMKQDPALCCEFDCETDSDGYCYKAERKK